MTYGKRHHIAVIDKTGRGHALCDKLLRQNPEVVIHYIPGTAGKYNKRIQPIWILKLMTTTPSQNNAKT